MELFQALCACDRWKLGGCTTVTTVKFTRVESTCSQCGRVAVYGGRCWAASVMRHSVIHI